ncbi:60S acidic ribosomal protein P2-like [Amaranthus tricolor]|uniref:60S acidic ribosomal protein P2-like n=1 Tax=Amaranthus tricolor TaxID=29722 RepID=UPI00258E57FF|nr:60S acidic ribosomal protein P2-like [Amaranthus tricolor]
MISPTIQSRVYINLPISQFQIFYSLFANSLKKPMKVIAAYLLACLGGNAIASSGDVKAIFNSVGIEADDDRIELFMSQVKDKDITELIAAGREKLASVPAGGGVAVAVAATGGAGGAAPAAAEFKKEEKVEQQEESDEEMGFSLFDD